MIASHRLNIGVYGDKPLIRDRNRWTRSPGNAMPDADVDFLHRKRGTVLPVWKSSPSCSDGYLGIADRRSVSTTLTAHDPKLRQLIAGQGRKLLILIGHLRVDPGNMSINRAGRHLTSDHRARRVIFLRISRRHGVSSPNCVMQQPLEKTTHLQLLAR
ncbi:MAG: hypothetical protein V4537_11705 [Pseudomonadota bacterium]